MQRVHDGVNRSAHEHRRVVDDPVIDALREIALELLHLRAHMLGDCDGVAAGTLKDGNGGGGLVVEQRTQRIGVCAELDSGDILEARHLAGGPGLQDDIAKVVLRRQAAFGVDRNLELGRIRQRRCPELPCGHLQVLLTDGFHHVVAR